MSESQQILIEQLQSNVESMAVLIRQLFDYPQDAPSDIVQVLTMEVYKLQTQRDERTKKIAAENEGLKADVQASGANWDALFQCFESIVKQLLTNAEREYATVEEQVDLTVGRIAFLQFENKQLKERVAAAEKEAAWENENFTPEEEAQMVPYKRMVVLEDLLQQRQEQVASLTSQLASARQQAIELAKLIFEEMSVASNAPNEGWRRPVLNTDDVVLNILVKQGFAQKHPSANLRWYRWKEAATQASPGEEGVG